MSAQICTPADLLSGGRNSGIEQTTPTNESRRVSFSRAVLEVEPGDNYRRHSFSQLKLNNCKLANGISVQHVRQFPERRSSAGSSLRSRRPSEEFHSRIRTDSVSETSDAVNDHILEDADMLYEKALAEGLNLRYYRPVSPKTMDEIMFARGTQGRQANKRQTVPDVLPGSARNRWSRLSDDSFQSDLEINRLSISSEPFNTGKRGSLPWRSETLLEKANRRGQTAQITRKFLFSSSQAGKPATEGSAGRIQKGPGISFGKSLGVRVMLKREQMLGGQRLAALGTLMAARKKFSHLDQYVLQFDAKIPWRKLQLWVRIRSMLGRLHQEVVDRVINDPSSPFYMQFKKDEDGIGIDRTHYMFFDPSDFKANRQMRTSQEVKRILTLPAEERTEEDIHCAMIGLRGISAIAEYPARMQRYLAEYGTFESYDAQRAIVRQGRPPEAFYYILYGKVLVAVRDEITGRVEIKCYLHRGHAFGELAIIKDSHRQSSVITKNYTELLCLSSDIFQKYFMVGGVKNLNDPDQNNFVRSLSFLKGWPMELILENTNQQNVTFGYFKRGSVLAKDSNYSDWLIIVKSGSLTVLKKLVKVRPTVCRKTGLPRIKANSNSYHSFLDNGGEFFRYLEQNNVKLPPPISLSDSNDDELDETDDYFNGASDDEVKRVKLANRPHTAAAEFMKPTINTKGVWSAAGKSRSTSNIVEFKSDTLLLKMEDEEKGRTTPRTKKVSTARPVSLNTEDDNVPELDDKKTYLDELDSAYNLRAHVVTEADLNPQFVFVQTLTKGDVFGLAQCLFCDQPSMCVVSNGADCLLLNKKLYLDNCSSELIRRLRVEISPYPSDEKLQEDLVTRVNWDSYKDVIRKQIYTQHKRKYQVSRPAL